MRRPYSTNQRTFLNRDKNYLSQSLNKKHERGISNNTKRYNQKNKISIISKDKENMMSTFNSFNRSNLRNKIFNLINEDEIEDEELKEIKRLWYDLGINKEYQNQFINLILDLNENNKKQFYSEEKKSLLNFRNLLLKLTKEISSRENNLITLKNLNNVLGTPEENINEENTINDIIKLIKTIRINSVNIISFTNKLREITYSKKEKFNLDNINSEYLYDKKYLIKMNTDIDFLEESNIKNYIDFSNYNSDTFFINCSTKSNNKLNKNKIIIPIEDDLMKAIKKAKYEIIQDIFFYNIEEKKNSNKKINNKSKLNESKTKLLKKKNKFTLSSYSNFPKIINEHKVNHHNQKYFDNSSFSKTNPKLIISKNNFYNSMNTQRSINNSNKNNISNSKEYID